MYGIRCFEEIKEHTGKLEDEIVKDAEGRESKVEGIPADPVKLHNSLPDILKKIGAKGKTIIVLDALNQLGYRPQGCKLAAK